MAGWKGKEGKRRERKGPRAPGAAADALRPRLFVHPIRWSECCGLQDALGPCSLCKHGDHRGNVLTPLASA